MRVAWCYRSKQPPDLLSSNMGIGSRVSAMSSESGPIIPADHSRLIQIKGASNCAGYNYFEIYQSNKLAREEFLSEPCASELSLKTTVIRMLGYPRSLVRGNVDLHDCPHAGQYVDTDAHCRLCEFAMECHWLCQNDEFVALGEKSVDQILKALSFALGYVDAETTKWGHRRQNCRCEACAWLRSAQRLYDKVSGEA